MLVRIAFVASVVATCVGAASAQTASETYALRQDLRNDSYVWEPILKRAAAPRSIPPSNPGGWPGGRAIARPFTQHQPDATAQAVLDYYAARRGVALARPAAAAPQAVTQAAYVAPDDSRPFEDTTTRPTVSAYLNLYNENLGDGAPNYHAYVRPRLEQERQIEKQRVQMERLRRRVQRTQAAAAPVRGSATPGVSRFGDTGRYYSGWRK